MTGTEGRDVIVANVTRLDADAGNDIVDASATNRQVDAELGAGSDQFVGGPQTDTVIAGEAEHFPLSGAPDAEPDVIDTGAGDDTIRTGTEGTVNADLGAGDDSFAATWDAASTGSTIDGGAGRDLLTLAGRTVRADLRRSTLEVDGRSSRIARFEDVHAEARYVTLIGDAQANELYGGLCKVRLVGGAGNDVLRPNVADSSMAACAARRISADGGQGRDSIAGSKGDDMLRGGRGREDVRTMSTMRRTTTLTALVIGAALLAPTGSATAAGETCRGQAATILGTGPVAHGTEARDVIVTGDSVRPRPVRLTAPKAGSSIDLGSGNDELRAVSTEGSVDLDLTSGTLTVDGGAAACTSGQTTLRGGSGNDRIDGGVRADRICGGAGNDKIETGPSRTGRGRRVRSRSVATLTACGAGGVLTSGPRPTAPRSARSTPRPWPRPRCARA